MTEREAEDEVARDMVGPSPSEVGEALRGARFPGGVAPRDEQEVWAARAATAEALLAVLCKEDNEEGFFCTLPLGHLGDHVAAGSNRRVYARWAP